MNVIATELPEVLILEPKLHGDSRGFFFESFEAGRFRELSGFEGAFVQDNHSRSSAGVLRGLHYQLAPKAQGKLVRVVRGAVLDVAVDIRRHSPRFGCWVAVELSEQNHRQLWVPPGFAHGFLTLSDSADFLYKVTETYSAAHERSVAWNDPDIGVAWPMGQVDIARLSAKDAAAPRLKDAEVFP